MNRVGTVVVVGGGLAGITAALRLADRGSDVTLLESRPRLGGATYSFSRGGLSVDTGQHVFLRCYLRYRELLDRLGVGHLVTIQPRLDIPVLVPRRSDIGLRRSMFGPAPLHLLPALAGYRALSPSERFRAALCAAALRNVDPDNPANDATTFGEWLHRHGQGPRAVSRLWGLLTVAALNIDPSEASLALAARVFRTGLLDHAGAGDMGIADVPLALLHDGPARTAFAQSGVRLHTGERVRAVAGSAAGHGLVVRTDSGELAADAVVMAVPHAAAARLVPTDAKTEPGCWDQLGDSPIVNVHVLFDRRVMDLPYAAVLDPATGWIFDRTAAAGVNSGQYLVSSLSAADAQIALPGADISRSHLAALNRVLPKARSAKVIDVFVTREPRATFRQRAGSARFRPQPGTKWPALVLAGAWTATGWPDTMEGAVRSGLSAADALSQSGPVRSALREVIV
ncbi:FAD-dependent oxidoreductase [Paeniglutamicibacter antarcticus]|uniref:FAD-dependent oxidoreductase n=1 Tax=Arthrobacter terrae TaxID=2935737 RepID=A0A931CL72_9MICC|nr:hydroxysqualene dehydroxylase HpnE [Arthrobacter terrae]MBG0740617.1 FAD-dependent oxidoreductase [Arthrobacter terrae]